VRLSNTLRLQFRLTLPLADHSVHENQTASRSEAEVVVLWMPVRIRRYLPMREKLA